MAPRTKFLANTPKTTKMLKQKMYFCKGVTTSKPKAVRLDTEAVPEAESLVNHLMRKKAQSQKNCAANVATDKYKPFTRKLGIPKKMPTNVAKKPPTNNAATKGMPSKRTQQLNAA